MGKGCKCCGGIYRHDEDCLVLLRQESADLRTTLEAVKQELGDCPPKFAETKDHYYKNADIKIGRALDLIKSVLK